MKKSSVVRFGLIGCGRIGRWHARNIEALPDLELIGVADVDSHTRGKAARVLGVRAFGTVDELLETPNIDVVCICTPPHTHVDLIEMSAMADKHVLVEKPLVLNLTEADRAVTACAARSIHLGVVHQQRARSATRTLHRLISDGLLGKPLLALAIHTWFKTQEELDRDPWRGESSTGGTLLLDQAVHAIDLLVWYLGEPQWVIGHTAVLSSKTSGEDTAVAIVGFKGGALATLTASTTANLSRDDIAIEMFGTHGGFRLEIRDYDNAEIVRLDLARKREKRARDLSAREIESLVQKEGGSWREGPRSVILRYLANIAGKERGKHPFRSPQAFLRRYADRAAQRERQEPQGHAAVLSQMADAVRGAGEPIVTGRDARHSLAVIDGIYRSQASGGQRIDLTS
jgi:predicted dehydrogenase